jgi:hypothetical protein
VAVMLLCFATLSYTAVLGKSATYDEPLHVVGGMVHRYANDFRINPEDPALFGWWASLPHSRDSLPLDTSNAFYEGATTGDTNQQWFFVVDALYGLGGSHSAGRDAAHADQFLNNSRAMFVILGVGLGALIACWAYQIGGPWAALFATVLYCFDPNFLAHSALVKNDVPLALMMCLLGFFLWRFGRDGGWYWLVLAAIASGLALNVKFSAVLFGPMAVLLLIGRASLPIPWTIAGRSIRSWISRSIVVLTGAVAIMLALFVITWAIYGFRYAATANGQPLNSQPLVEKAVRNLALVQVGADHANRITNQDFTAMVQERLRKEDLPAAVNVDLWMQKIHLLPEAWLYGFLYTYATTLYRSAYLMGSVAQTGKWYYFPMAILFKTPAATLAALLLIPIGCLLTWKRQRAAGPPQTEEDEVPHIPFWTGWWTALALLIPPVIYFAAALTTNLNLGLRHILPIYPYLFITLGVGMAALLERWTVPALLVCGLITFGLIAETACTYPNYLAFFNVFSGGSSGGIKLLGDSNLDWGQDLPALAQWQKEHPTDKLYLCYFGMADPNAYGIDFTNLPGGWPFAPARNLSANEPGVVAISATNLQGIYLGPQLMDAYFKALQGEKAFTILNGTIYLFKWPPRPPGEETN